MNWTLHVKNPFILTRRYKLIDVQELLRILKLELLSTSFQMITLRLENFTIVCLLEPSHNFL